MKRGTIISIFAATAIFAVACEGDRIPETGGGNTGGNHGGGGGNPSEITYTFNNIRTADLVYVSTS